MRPLSGLEQPLKWITCWEKISCTLLVFFFFFVALLMLGCSFWKGCVQWTVWTSMLCWPRNKKQQIESNRRIRGERLDQLTWTQGVQKLVYLVWAELSFLCVSRLTDKRNKKQDFQILDTSFSLHWKEKENREGGWLARKIIICSYGCLTYYINGWICCKCIHADCVFKKKKHGPTSSVQKLLWCVILHDIPYCITFLFSFSAVIMGIYRIELFFKDILGGSSCWKGRKVSLWPEGCRCNLWTVRINLCESESKTENHDWGALEQDP